MLYKSCLTLLFIVGVGLISYSQNLSPERKLYKLRQAEYAISNLNYSLEKIRDEFIPEVHSSRDSIAPHYPDQSQLQRDDQIIDQAFYSWIDMYPSEYDNYLNYLNLFYRERKQ